MCSENQETIQVLIENYNSVTKKYGIGRQEIKNITIEEFKNMLNDIPKESDYKAFKPSIVTKDRIFTKDDENSILYEYNYEKVSFGIPEFRYFKHFCDPDSSHHIKLMEYEKVVKRKDIKKSNLFRVFFSIAMFIPLILIPFNMFIPLIFILFTMFIPLKNVYLYVLLLWLLGISGYAIGFNIYQLKKEIFRKEIKYSNSILDSIKTVDLSIFLIYMLGFFGAYFITFYSKGFQYDIGDPLILLNLILIIIVLIIQFYSMVIIVLYKNYKAIKDFKQVCLDNLYEYLQRRQDDWGFKQYLLQLAIELEKKPLYKLGILSKFVIVLTFILNFIPFII